jgi:hypothetical protein
MPLAWDASLAKLCRLSPAALDKTSRRIRSEHGLLEWKLAMCLLAQSRTSSFQKLGFSTISQYAERALQLSGKKARALLGVARALEHLPVLSEAFQSGKLPWAKLRAIQSLVTPETEQAWLEFCLQHRTDEVVRKVTLSPATWKKQQALAASVQGQPLACVEEVKSLLSAQPTNDNTTTDDSTSANTTSASPTTDHTANAHTTNAHTATGTPTADQTKLTTPPTGVTSANPTSHDNSATTAGEPVDGGVSDTACLQNHDRPTQTSPTPQLPTAPRTIRLVLELTPDQYALYERAEGRVRARLGKRVSRAEVLHHLASAYLDGGSSRSRAKHQVVIHRPEESDEGYYITERGLLPVDRQVLEQAEKQQQKRGEQKLKREQQQGAPE